MQTVTPPSAGRVIFREGLIFGVLLGVVHIVLSLVNQLLARAGLGLLGLLLIVLLWLGVFFWVGARGAKQTGRVGVGSLAGLMTAVFAGLVSFIYWMIIGSAQSPLILDTYQSYVATHNPQSTHVAMTTASIVVILAICGVVLWLLGIGMGAGMGALGGLLGRSQSTVIPPMSSAYPPYGYMPPPMQPVYPPPYPPPYMPPYPNQPPQAPYPNQAPPQPPDQS